MCDIFEEVETEVPSKEAPIQPLSYYMSFGGIHKGDMIPTPLIEKEVIIDGRPVKTNVQGHKQLMDNMFGIHWQIHEHIDYIELQKPGFLFELYAYAKENMKVGFDLGLNQNESDSDWMVSKTSFDTLDTYRSFVNTLKSNGRSKFAMFASCMPKDPEATATIVGDMAVMFLGIYELDKAASLFYHRFVLHFVDETYNFAI